MALVSTAKSLWKDVNSRFRQCSRVGWIAFVFGTVLAFASYLLVLFPKDEWMRSSYLYDVEHDSLFKFGTRFLLGAVGGALVGLLHIIRTQRDRKNKSEP